MLHDVSFVDSCDFFTSVDVSEFKSVLSDFKRMFFCDDFNRFDDTWVDFMFDTCEFTFCVFSDNDDIDVLMTCSYSWDGKSRHHVSV